jgi:hypothetical protein
MPERKKQSNEMRPESMSHLDLSLSELFNYENFSDVGDAEDAPANGNCEELFDDDQEYQEFMEEQCLIDEHYIDEDDDFIPENLKNARMSLEDELSMLLNVGLILTGNFEKEYDYTTFLNHIIFIIYLKIIRYIKN